MFIIAGILPLSSVSFSIFILKQNKLWSICRLINCLTNNYSFNTWDHFTNCVMDHLQVRKNNDHNTSFNMAAVSSRDYILTVFGYDGCRKNKGYARRRKLYLEFLPFIISERWQIVAYKLVKYTSLPIAQNAICSRICNDLISVTLPQSR